MLASQKDAKR